MSDVKTLLLRAGFRPIAFNPFYARISGCVKAGLLLSQAMYWQENVGADQWFYKTQQDWQLETFLTRTEQESARKTLAELGLLEMRLAGMPAKVHYRVNLLALADRLTEFQPAGNPQPSMQETCKQDVGKLRTGLRDSRKPYKEAETTTENTAESKSARFIPPSLDEVKAYCLERKNSVNPVKWFNHYTSNGWRVGRVPMKNWKAAVHTWEQNDKGNGNGKQSSAERLNQELSFFER
jgi:hypothetical protein